MFDRFVAFCASREPRGFVRRFAITWAFWVIGGRWDWR